MKGILKAAAFGAGFGATFIAGAAAVIGGSFLMLKRMGKKMEVERVANENLRRTFNKIVKDFGE